MDNRNKQHNSSIDHLGVNKIGKNIRKTTPLHHQQQQQQEYTTNPQSQPQVYNINKNDFRSIVQQLTGLSSQEVQQLPPPSAPPRPPPSATNNMRLQKIRPPPLASLVNRPQMPQPTNTTESPVTTYMRYLQNPIVVEPGQAVDEVQQPQSQPQTSSTTSTVLPSPSGFLNLISPKSPFPLLSPGYQFPYPLTPNFPFSPLGLSGILGNPGQQQPPLSPGFGFSLSPSSFFPVSSPSWRDH